jgi:hypothetical protein
MADLLMKPRQLAPTMGPNASGARIQAGSAFAGIGATVAIGCVLYDSDFPIVPADKFWVPAREDPARFTVVPIGDIHIFIGETNPTPATKTNFRRIGMAETPKWTAFELDTEEESSNLELSKSSGSDLKTNPTQPALEVEEVVDDRYESAMSNLALEAPRSCWALNDTRQRARSEDHVKMQRPRTRGATAAGEMKRRATQQSSRRQTTMMARQFTAGHCANALIPVLGLDASMPPRL